MIAYHATTSRENAIAICEHGVDTTRYGTHATHIGHGFYLTTTKKRARLYGTHILTVTLANVRLQCLQDDWLIHYRIACQDAYARGIPEQAVNAIVGEQLKQKALDEGYDGILLPRLLTSKGQDLVLYHLEKIQHITHA